jgi:hypothetical protein
MCQLTTKEINLYRTLLWIIAHLWLKSIECIGFNRFEIKNQIESLASNRSTVDWEEDGSHTSINLQKLQPIPSILAISYSGHLEKPQQIILNHEPSSAFSQINQPNHELFDCICLLLLFSTAKSIHPVIIE